MKFHQEFIIHPVGQGLFYSGIIKFNSKVKFRMVFDCGSKGNSKSAGEEEVDNYRDIDYIENKILDLLVISHFDEDHVNHIGRLLADGIKVKKLVMPFITFTERLFLILRYFDENESDYGDDDFFIRFIIDPLGSINENLDGDSDVFLVYGEPEDPILQEKEITNEGNSSEGNSSEVENIRFAFDYDKEAKESIDLGEIVTSEPKGKVYKVNHTNKGKVKSGGLNLLMEFLFYRRKISVDDTEFFETIKDEFFKEFSITEELKGKELLIKIAEVVKGITSAKRIKPIFIEAKKAMGLKSKKDVIEIENMNTTSLCLFHRNLNGMFDLQGISKEMWKHLPNRWSNLNNWNFYQIQKFISGSRIESKMHLEPSFYWACRNNESNFIFPNVMLTADSFLITSTQVSEFINHYKNYWGNFWLFQIPHHGSEKSSDKLLHSHIPSHSFNFINYGIGNTFSHPSPSVINDLVATGNSTRLIPINQYMGLKFQFVL